MHCFSMTLRFADHASSILIGYNQPDADPRIVRKVPEKILRVGSLAACENCCIDHGRKNNHNVPLHALPAHWFFILLAAMILEYIIWDPSPEIFTIPGIDWPVRWYGLMWALAFIGSHVVMNRVYKAEGRTDKQLDTLTLYIILGTVIGARVGHCLFYGPWFDEYDMYGRVINEGYLSHPLNILKVYEGGLASHGGAIGIIIAMLLYCRK